MNMLTRRLSAVALVLAAVVSMTTLTTAGAADGAWTGGPVTIRVELDLPDANGEELPLVQQVTNVVPGDQVELTSADITDNPADWSGSVWVDIDPVAMTVQVSTGQVPDAEAETPAAAPTSPVTGLQNGFRWDDDVFETVKVTITGPGFDSLTLVSDGLWESGGEVMSPATAPQSAAPLPGSMQLVDVSVNAAGDGSIGWQSDPVTETYGLNTPGAALFAYTQPEPEAPTTTVTKPDVEAETTTPPPAAKPAAPVTRKPNYTG